MKNVPYVWYALLLCIAAPVVSSAQTFSPFQFLRSNISARSAALGESTVAAMDDASNIVINPATVFNIEDSKLTATFVKHVLDINSGVVSYVGSLPAGGKWAAVASYTSYGSFEGKDAFGNATGRSYGAAQVAIGGTYANEIDSGFYYGVGLNLVNASYADASTFALAANAGLLYKIPGSRWNAGLSILNLGTQLSTINGVSEPLPTDVRLGVNHRLRGLPMLINFAFNHLVEKNVAVFDHFKNFSLGGELYVGKIVELRLGYNNTVRNSASFPVGSRLAGISFGVGIKVKQIAIDYGLSSLISGVFVHRFSVLTVL